MIPIIVGLNLGGTVSILKHLVRLDLPVSSSSRYFVDCVRGKRDDPLRRLLYDLDMIFPEVTYPTGFF